MLDVCGETLIGDSRKLFNNYEDNFLNVWAMMMKNAWDVDWDWQSSASSDGASVFQLDQKM